MSNSDLSDKLSKAISTAAQAQKTFDDFPEDWKYENFGKRDGGGMRTMTRVYSQLHTKMYNTRHQVVLAALDCLRELVEVDYKEAL